MFRALFIAAVSIGLFATPTVRADGPEKKLSTATPVEKIIAALHDGKMDYEKDLRTTPFKEVIENLSKQFNVKFVMNKAAIGEMSPQLETAKAETFAATGIDNMTLGTFLKAYLPALAVENVTYLVRADHIEITSSGAAAKEVGLQEDEAEAQGSVPLIRAAARFQLPIICLAVKERPITMVFDDLRRVYGLNIVVSPACKEQLKTPITVQLLNVPADTALELIAEQAELGVVRKGNTFRIISNPGA
jgi:hypothetical protein